MKKYVDEELFNTLITRLEEVENKMTSIENCYPIGSIYLSVNTTNPNSILGFGTWEQLQDRFLVGAGGTYAVGATGGEETHKLTVSEMPSHTHMAKGWAAVVDGSGSYKTLGAEGISRTYSPDSTGGGKAHNNMPPYLAVYMWKRTA